MNYQEEQESELQALSEIYYNEIKVISDKPPMSFIIKIRPQASNFCDESHVQAGNLSDGDDDEDNQNSSDDDDDIYESENSSESFVSIKFDLPQKYPDEKPSIEVFNSSGLNSNDLSQLASMIDKKADESLGMVMVFTIVSEVVEWLVNKSNEDTDQEKKSPQENEASDKKPSAEPKRFEGTPVTVETFMAWKAKFDAELSRERLEKQALENPTDSRRLTGREMFESDKTLAESDLNFVEDLDQSELEALLFEVEEQPDT